MSNHYIPTDEYRAMRDKLASARPSIDQPDLATVIVEILGEYGIWPDYCREPDPCLTARRRNYV